MGEMAEQHQIVVDLIWRAIEIGAGNLNEVVAYVNTFSAIMIDEATIESIMRDEGIFEERNSFRINT